MASGTYSGNLQIIRSTGVYGGDVREAIASVIEQAGSIVANDEVAAAVAAVTSMANSTVSSINRTVSNTVSSINSAINSAQNSINSAVNGIDARVNSRNVYMTTTVISGDEYLLTIKNAS
jgi:phage-related protein